MRTHGRMFLLRSNLPNHRLLSTATETTVNTLSRTLSDHRSPTSDLPLHLAPFSKTLTPSLLHQTLLRCRHLPVPSHRFFIFSLSLPDFSPSPSSHRLLLSILSRHRLFPLFWAHLLDHPHFPLSNDLFHLAFSAYSRSNLPLDAIKSFHKMSDFPSITPSSDDVNALIFSLCKNKHVADADRFLVDAIGQGLGFNKKSFGILIQGWANLGKFKEAQKAFDEMRKRNWTDVEAYNSLMMAYCKAGNIEEAGRILKQMRLKHGIEPNAGSYGVFIRAYCDMKDSKSALRMVENAKRKGLVLNTFTYNCVIKLLCEEDDMNEVYELLNEMNDPDIWTYNRIMEVHCKKVEMNKAIGVMKRMDEKGYNPDQHTYNMLIKMLLGVGRVDKAEEVWEGMGKRGYYPKASNYAVMIHGLCRKKGGVEKGLKYFDEMVREGVPPYDSTCVVLREELLRRGMKEKVDIVVDRMRRSSSSVIRGLADVLETGSGIGRRKSHKYEDENFENGSQEEEEQDWQNCEL